jgi:hypothetical protein
LYLDVEFDEVDREPTGGVEREDRVLFYFLHPTVRRGQSVHPLSSVPHHQKFRWLLLRLHITYSINPTNGQENHTVVGLDAHQRKEREIDLGEEEVPDGR